jgi:polynucleotide 5'-hydroxyl-kinase GRC3/NOL9
MKKIIEKDKTLLVDGPASVSILSGKAQVFGSPIRHNRRIIIRGGKRLPFAVEETANFEISLGVDARIEEKEGNSIPASWKTAYNALLEIQQKPVIAMILGSVDSGKTSFCNYLANKLLTNKFNVSVLDEDLGQSDIGAPCTIAYSHMARPVTDLYDLEPENTFFVGSTSPQEATNIVINGIKILKAEIENRETADFVLVNTDGWSGNEEATQFKSELAGSIEPDVVFCLQATDEIPSFCATLGDALAGFRQERAESPIDVKERSSEKRRKLREIGFAKYLENARVKVFPLNHITIPNREDSVLIRNGEADNLLVGLFDTKKNFLGIGIVRSVDYTRRSLKVLTSVTEKPAAVVFGKVRLDENLHEIPRNGKPAVQ